MKITFDKQVELLAGGFGELETGERPPFLQCDITKIYTETINDEEIVVFEDLANRGYVRQLYGVDYYLINSYDNIGTISGTPSGLVSWKDGQVPTDEIQYHIDLFGVDNVIMYDDFIERKVIEEMTLEELKEKVGSELLAELNDVTFQLSVVSNAKGEDKTYTINIKTVSELESQLNRASLYGGTIQMHDDSLIDHEEYTVEEATKLYTDASIAVGFRNGTIAAYRHRVNDATTKEEVLSVQDTDLTEEENATITTMVMKSLGQA